VAYDSKVALSSVKHHLDDLLSDVVGLLSIEGEGAGVVADSEDEGFTYGGSEVEEIGLGPEGLGLGEVGHDVGVVPEEVVLEALLEEGGVAEDGEELAELVEVLGDFAAVVGGNGNLIDEVLHVEDAGGDAPEGALGEVVHSVLNVGHHSLGTVHAAEQVVEVVFVDDAVHDTGEDLDDSLNGNVLS
jgi:hypothetical protein